MDRRDFLKYGSWGTAGLAVGASGMLDAAMPASALALGATPRRAAGRNAWKFGVMADTQWQGNVDGLNPGTVAVGIVNIMNAQFAHHGVEFVIQVGDLVDKETAATGVPAMARTMPVRAMAAETLYDNGIGFFPVRGNHEGSGTAAAEFQTLYPQARGTGPQVFKARNFSSPFPALDGVSYSFDWNNARFVLIDQFVRVGETTRDLNTATIDQLPWVDGALSGRASGSHAFVLAHKNLIGQNHIDCVLGEDPSKNPAARNDFIGSMARNRVGYYMGGHDHMHHRSRIKSPDGASAVKQLICASNSYKFYTPAGPNYQGDNGSYVPNDVYYDNPTVETPFAQELYSIGYYVYTVDGPRVTVDFYAATAGLPYDSLDGHSLTKTPTSRPGFFLRDSWGYSLNGKEFVVAQGGKLDVVKDSFHGTKAAILGGKVSSTATDSALRPLSKDVNTGWQRETSHDSLMSNVLSLWGLCESDALWAKTADLLPASATSMVTDTFALSMSFEGGFGLGKYGIASPDAHGRWVNAVNLNTGGTRKFVNGPWRASYGLGTWGVDHRTHTAWAVVNHEGDFAVSRGL